MTPETALSQEMALKTMVRLPQFLIVGAMKAGTTSLYSYLRRHPDIYMPCTKEPQFFSRDHVFEQGLNWYSDFFAQAGPEQICGEASTCYSRWPFFPHAAERIAKALPAVKLIFILRHPVERLYSDYEHKMRSRFMQGETTIPSFEEFVEEDEEARCASQYVLQLHHLYQYFDAAQICIVLLEDLKAKPREVLDQLQSFLGVSAVDLLGEETIQANSAEAALGVRLPMKRSGRFLHRLRSMPPFKGLIDVLPVEWRQRVRARIQQRMAESVLGRRKTSKLHQQLVPMSVETRSRLCSQFADEVKALETILHRDLTGWTK